MKIKTAIDIACTPEEVFAWIRNPEMAMQWQKGVKRGEIIKETPGITGTTFKEEMEENGKTLVMYGEITGYVPGVSMSFQLESKIHRVSVAYTVVGDTDKSTVTVSSDIKWKFPMNLVCLFIGHSIKSNILRQTNAELAALKTLCETKQHDSSPKT